MPIVPRTERKNLRSGETSRKPTLTELLGKAGEELHEACRNKPAAATVMPFGKYKGLPLSDLATDYLEWLSHRGLYGLLLSAVNDELVARGEMTSVIVDDEGRPLPCQ